jgi:integrase
MTVASPARSIAAGSVQAAERSFFVLRQFEPLPRPLVSEQACELLASLPPPYDLMARWQLYTGLRVSELLRLGLADITKQRQQFAQYETIPVIRKGRKSGHVIASASLLDETAGYVAGHRHAWLQRAGLRRRGGEHAALFINARGAPAGKSAYQRMVSATGRRCGFKATTHLLRSTFACMLLARLERLASEGAAINPLLVVKVLMGHERIETTDRYLRAIVVDAVVLKDVLDTLLSAER